MERIINELSAKKHETFLQKKKTGRFFSTAGTNDIQLKTIIKLRHRRRDFLKLHTSLILVSPFE